MKINLGAVTKKKYPHKLPKNVYTSSDFGFLQPFYCRECIAQDSFTIRNGSMVRLNPVVKPTFGHMYMKQYSTFVPIEEIYHAFGSFMKGEPYSGAINTYVPTVLPNMSLLYLSWFVYCCSDVYEYTFTLDSANNFSALSVASTSKANLKASVLSVYGNTVGAPVNWLIDKADGLLPYIDFVIDTSVPETFDKFDWVLVDSTNKRIFGGRFTERGCNLRKVLIGLGYQIFASNDIKSILPLVAFYKAYFDIFAPQRTITWKNTNIYKVMEWQEQSGYSIEALLGNTYAAISTCFIDFMWKDLPTSYYTQQVDFAAAHISGTAVGAANDPFPTAVQSGSDNAVNPINQQPEILTSDGDYINQNQLDILKRLYSRVNKNTAIGGKIREFMRVVLGSDYDQDDKSHFIGSRTQVIDVTEVMSTAITSEGYLGEYAGKGSLFDPAHDGILKFTCHAPGYLIQMFTFVPEARLCQAVDPNLDHLRKDDFFHEDMDAITLVPSKRQSIFGSSIFANEASLFKNGFGNIPNYTEYKVSFDTLNGDMSLPSVKNSCLPFTLSKYINADTIFYDTSSDHGEWHFPNASYFVAGEFWRYIGRNKWLGNFDRIFENSGELYDDVTDDVGWFDMASNRLDDNFYVYIYCDVQVMSTAKSLADSFQTDSFGDYITVEKQ